VISVQCHQMLRGGKDSVHHSIPGLHHSTITVQKPNAA